MMRYDTLANDKDSVKLVGQVMNSGERWISITFKKEWNSEDSIEWDNDKYIFGKFYKFLKRYLNKELKKKDKKKFDDIWHLLNDDWAIEVLEILNEALKLGWYAG